MTEVHVCRSQKISIQHVAMKSYDLCCHFNRGNHWICNVVMQHGVALKWLHTSVAMTLMRVTADVRHHVGKSAYFCPSVVSASVSWLNLRMQSPPLHQLWTHPRAFGLLRLVTAVIASYSRCHSPPPLPTPPSGSPPAIGKCPTSPHSLWLIWSSKFHSGTGRQPWSIGHTWGEAFPVPPPSSPHRQLRLKTDKYPLQLLRYFPFLVVSLAWCAPVPVSTFSPPLLCFSPLTFASLAPLEMTSQDRRVLTSIILKLLFFFFFGRGGSFLFIYSNIFAKVNRSLCKQVQCNNKKKKNQCQGRVKEGTELEQRWLWLSIIKIQAAQQAWQYFNLVHRWTRNLPCFSQTKQNGRSFAISPERKGSKPEWPENRNELLLLKPQKPEQPDQTGRFVKLIECSIQKGVFILITSWQCVGRCITACAWHVGPVHLAPSREQWEHHRHLSHEHRGLTEQKGITLRGSR